MFEKFRSLLVPQKQALIVMRASDMRFVHPLTDFSHKCSKCKAKVGIYPSGQALIKKVGEAKIEIICNRCVSKKEVTAAQPAPGSIEEIGESIRNPEQEREP